MNKLNKNGQYRLCFAGFLKNSCFTGTPAELREIWKREAGREFEVETFGEQHLTGWNGWDLTDLRGNVMASGTFERGLHAGLIGDGEAMLEADEEVAYTSDGQTVTQEQMHGVPEGDHTVEVPGKPRRRRGY